MWIKFRIMSALQCPPPPKATVSKMEHLQNTVFVEICVNTAPFYGDVQCHTCMFIEVTQRCER
jgi:hypothetical protein